MHKLAPFFSTSIRFSSGVRSSESPLESVRPGNIERLLSFVAMLPHKVP
jgi:hypothetical protein